MTYLYVLVIFLNTGFDGGIKREFYNIESCAAVGTVLSTQMHLLTGKKVGWTCVKQEIENGAIL